MRDQYDRAVKARAAARAEAEAQACREAQRDPEVEWHRALEIIGVLMECGTIPQPPPECRHEHEGVLCPACVSWQDGVDRWARDAVADPHGRRMCELVLNFARIEEWPLSAEAWSLLDDPSDARLLC